MTLQTIMPTEVKRLMEHGAVLVDVREAGEHARERIPRVSDRARATAR